MGDGMKTLEDVLLYLARSVPSGPADLADMERIIGETFAAAPAPAQPEQPAAPEQPAG